MANKDIIMTALTPPGSITFKIDNRAYTLTEKTENNDRFFDCIEVSQSETGELKFAKFLRDEKKKLTQNNIHRLHRMTIITTRTVIYSTTSLDKLKELIIATFSQPNGTLTNQNSTQIKIKSQSTQVEMCGIQLEGAQHAEIFQIPPGNLDTLLGQKLQSTPLDHITEFTIGSNHLQNIDFINRLKNLITLRVTNNPIQQIPDLTALKNLKELILQSCQIKTIKNLPKGITHLNLSGNEIENIKNLPNTLIELYLCSNNITTIEDLCATLQTLNLCANKIRDIKNLPEGITHLNLSSNEIENIKNLPPFLKEAYLSNNKIIKIENLPKSLKTLSLCFNEIKETPDLSDSLTINLLGNPVTEGDNKEKDLNTSTKPTTPGKKRRVPPSQKRKKGKEGKEEEKITKPAKKSGRPLSQKRKKGKEEEEPTAPNQQKPQESNPVPLAIEKYDALPYAPLDDWKTDILFLELQTAQPFSGMEP